MKLSTAHVEQQVERRVGVVDLLRPLLTHAKFADAAAEFLTTVAQVFECERASLGFVSGKIVKVCAVSHHHQDFQDAVLPEVAAAMEESLLQDVALIHPDNGNAFPHILLAHAELARSRGLTGVLTMPLAEDGQLIGAMTLETRRKGGFAPEHMELLEQLASHSGSLLHLKWRLQQPSFKRATSAVRAALQSVLHEDGLLASRRARYVAAGIVAGVFALLFLLPLPHRVAGNAHLDALVQRVITSPIDGYLKEVRVRPGDKVKAKQTLAELNDETLRSEYRRLDAEAAQQENALAEAMVNADRTQVALRRAKLDEVTAQRDLIAQQLDRTQLTSPFDGVVIKGDLTQLLGSPLKRGDVLLTLSQGPEFRVIVEVPEREIGDLKVGASGKLVLSAVPDKSFAIHVSRITPVATVATDGQNIFEVEAALDKGEPELVPGLKGVAKLTTGYRPVAWDWVARAWHGLTFFVWSKL
jgi:biotin carboxyl carrier protein